MSKFGLDKCVVQPGCHETGRGVTVICLKPCGGCVMRKNLVTSPDGNHTYHITHTHTKASPTSTLGNNTSCAMHDEVF